MITLTIREAMEVARALKAMPPCAPKAGYDLSIIQNRIKSALRPVEEQRRQILEANGGTLSDSGVIKWSNPEGQEAADREFADYLTKEIEIDRNPVAFAALIDMPAEKRPAFQPEVLSVLEKIIVE